MKFIKGLLVLLIFFLSEGMYGQTRYWVAAGAANWSGNNWSSISGGTVDGIGPPTAAEQAEFNVNGLGNCTVDAVNPSVVGLVVNGYTGLIDVNGTTLTSSGTVTLTSGTINDLIGTGSLIISSTGTTTFNGTSFGAVVTASSGSLLLNGSTFNANSSFSKTGTGNNLGAGGNVFNGTVNIVHSGSNVLYLARTNPDDFNSTLSISNTGAGSIRLSDVAAGNTYDGNITVSSTGSSQGIYFGNGGGTSTLATGFTLADGTFSIGTLILRNFTQSGATVQNITLTGTAVLTLYDSNWGGNAVFSSARMTTRGSTYLGTSSFSKTGASNDRSVGGNIFTGNAVINNSGSGYFLFGDSSPDAFSANLDMSNTGTRHIYLAYNSLGNTIGGSLTAVNSGSTSCALYFANNTGSSLTVTGNTTISNNGSGTTSRVYLGNNGDITFNGTVTLNNSSTAANSQIYCNQSATSLNVYNGNVIITNSNASSDGVYFGNDQGSSTLAAGQSISIGGAGFIAGALTLRNFTQVGATVQSLAATGTTLLTLYNSSFGGDVVFSSPRISTRGTIYSGTSSLTKNGATDDNSAGGNFFTGNVILNNSGSGHFRMGDGTSDAFMADLTMNLTGSDHLQIAYNSAGNTIGGSLVATNSGTGFGSLYFSNSSSSSLVVTGNTIITNNGSGATSRVYLGNNGDITFNGTVTLNNSSTAANSQIYCNQSVTSSNIYNGNIIVSNSNASSDGVYFGNNQGSSTLAAGQTISIGGAGFIAGALTLRNFTQVGATVQSLAATGTSLLVLYNSSFGGDVVFSSPRISTRGTIYSGTASLIKNGATDDNSAGGNSFTGDVILNNSGSGYIRMGDGSPDTFAANVSISKTGSDHVYLAYNSAGNTIGGNLTASNSGSIVGNLYFSNSSSSSLLVTGNTVITNNGSGTTSQVFLGYNGDITFNGTVTLNNSSTATNSQIYCNYDNNSTNIYNGNIIISNSNASSDGVLFGNSEGSSTLAAGQTISIGGAGFIASNLYLRNFTQTGATAQFLALTGTTLLTLYNSSFGGDVVFSSPRINTRGTTYSGTGALTKNGASDDASIGGNSFTGNVVMTNTGSGYFMMGNGSPDTFTADLDILNTGSRHCYIAYNSAGNTIGGNLTVTNSGTGTSHIYLSDQTASTLNVSGTTSLTNSGSGTDSRVYLGNRGDVSLGSTLNLTNSYTGTLGIIYVASNTNSIVAVTGATTVLNNGTGGDCRTYLGNSGDVTFGDDLSIINSVSGASGQVYIGINSSSSTSIAGNTTVSNSGAGTTKRVYLGSDGDVTFDGTLTIDNSSSATNSQVYCNNDNNSVNVYNGNISITNSNASGDGVLFGSSEGTGTLAAGQTVTIGGAGFASGALSFRNFTQVGPTVQNLAPTGTTTMTLYDCNWGGDIIFSSPRITTRGTVYSGTSSLTKNGTTDDNSSGGNIFSGNAIINNSGTGYIRMGVTSPDVFGADLTMTNTGSRHMYLGYSSIGNTVAGNLSVTNSGTGTSYIYLSDQTASSLSVTGTTSITNNGTGGDCRVYLASSGDIILGNSLSIINAASGAIGEVQLASGTNSSLSIVGSTTVTNSGTGTTKRVYLGNNGDITFNGSLSIDNSSSATNSQVYSNNNSNGVNNYNGNITVSNSNVNGDGVLFGSAGGSGTLAAGLTVSISGAGFVAGSLYFRNFI
ncbi:MAG: hypothetical protein JKY48_08600, partial [Flavobacteriales bacterium]|nr:hypothetical protein [Flavobacteriales bacterium]